MREVKTIKLEDGKNYILVSEIELDGNTYYFLGNIENEKDACVRKKVIKDNAEYLAKLDSQEELKQAMDAFRKKHI